MLLGKCYGAVIILAIDTACVKNLNGIHFIDDPQQIGFLPGPFTQAIKWDVKR